MRQGTPRMAGLDTLRAAAIVAVMGYHMNWVLPPAFEVFGHFGWMGVDLFFVLSGYLIGSQLVRPYLLGKRTSLAAFYRRRAWRILPAYGVVLALYWLVPIWREQPGMSPAWEFLTFTENLFVDYGRNQAFSHVWSLCIEEHFYLALPLMLAVAMPRGSLRRTLTIAGAVVLAGVGLRWWALVHGLRPLGDDFDTAYIEKIYYPTWTRLDGLLAGVMLALMRAFRPGWWEWLGRRGHASLIGGAALVGITVWMFFGRFESLYGVAAWSTVIGFPLLSLGLALVVASAVSGNGWLARFAVPGARPVAAMAFSLYLTHKEVLHGDRVLWPWLRGNRGWGAAAVYGVTCLVVGAVLYLGVERPGLRLRDRLERRTARVDDEVRAEPAL